MYKRLNDFKKRINQLKAVDPQTNENKFLKPKVLDNVGDLFNDLYYIYKDKYNEEKDGLNTKNKKCLYYRKLSLTDGYQYEFEKEEEENNRLVKILIKRNHVNNQQKIMPVILMNGLIEKKQT